MIVCLCLRVSNRDIEHSALSGCTSFDELQMELGVSTCCGRCADCARQVFDAARQLGSAGTLQASAPTLPMAA